jgi:polyisoprenoid-binding protein YceI
MSTTSMATATQFWAIDPAHTVVEFAVKHMMVATVKGRFSGVEGLVRAKDLGEGHGDGSEDQVDSGWSAEIRIDAATIDTHAPQRDAHLRSADFLDVEEHPSITFRSTEVDGSFDRAGDRFRVAGDLTIRGVTRQVWLDVVYHGSGRDPWGGERLMFSAKTRIDRRDYGLTWNQALEAGGVLVANDLTINLDVQLVKEG